MMSVSLSAQPWPVHSLIKDWAENIDGKFISFVSDVKSGRDAKMMDAKVRFRIILTA